MRWLRPGADQSSKAAFGKSTFAKTCFLLLRIRLAHINRAKSKNAFEHILARFGKKAFSSLHVPKRARKYLCFFLGWLCTSHFYNKIKQVRACFSKTAFAKSSFARLVCARPNNACSRKVGSLHDLNLIQYEKDNPPSHPYCVISLLCIKETYVISPYLHLFYLL